MKVVLYDILPLEYERIAGIEDESIQETVLSAVRYYVNKMGKDRFVDLVGEITSMTKADIRISAILSMDTLVHDITSDYEVLVDLILDLTTLELHFRRVEINDYEDGKREVWSLPIGHLVI